MFRSLLAPSLRQPPTLTLCTFSLWVLAQGGGQAPKAHEEGPPVGVSAGKGHLSLRLSPASPGGAWACFLPQAQLCGQAHTHC